METRLGERLRKVQGSWDRRHVGQIPFCIVSDDCWAGALYQHLGRPYNTPFVGLRILARDYLRLLQNLDAYLVKPLEFGEWAEHENGVRFPVGSLGDVQIRFIHYKSESEAKEKWNRRMSRMDFNHLFVKFTARPEATREDRAEFARLPYSRKLLLDHEEVDWAEDAVVLFRRTRRIGLDWLSSSKSSLNPAQPAPH